MSCLRQNFRFWQLRSLLVEGSS